jgi:tRNA(Ile)-lysidine synthase
MLERIASALREHCSIVPPALLVVGVSGGPDSLCLMHGLHHLGFGLVVAHLDHALRPESAGEALGVKVAAAALGLDCVVERADVRGHARARGLSIEEAARKLRYRFLFGQARACRAGAVAVGHTADDQVETVLMHMIRGAGLDGLAGMSYRIVLPLMDPEIAIVRPLLGVWREDTIAYCESNALTPHFDRSNESPDFFRNRVRHELVPLLESMNPRAREALWRAAQSLAVDRGLVAARVAEAWDATVVRETREFVGFDASDLVLLSIPLQRRLIREAARRLAPETEIGYAALERGGRFVAEASSAPQELGGGLVLAREADLIYVANGDKGLPFDAWPQLPEEVESLPVSVPDRVGLAHDWYFKLEGVESLPSALEDCHQAGFRACLDADALPARLELRRRRPGDRFEPLGLDGHTQKVSDFFVNVKMPVRARQRWPLLCSGTRVIWVPGYRAAETCKVHKNTRRVVRLEVGRPAQD